MTDVKSELQDEREVSQSLREQLIAAEARIAELEYERVGNHLVSFSAYDVLSRAERDRDALRASWREAVEVAERNAIDCAHLRHSAITLEAERDALKEELDLMHRVRDSMMAEAAESKAERDALKLELQEARNEALGHRNVREHAERIRDTAHKEMVEGRHEIASLTVERDALRARGPTREELEYTRAMALLKQRYGDPLGDDLSDHVARLAAQVEAARAYAHLLTSFDGNLNGTALELLAAMDEACQGRQ